MNNTSPKTIKGKITSINVSGFGPNSGELTIHIGPHGQNVYAGILDQNHHQDGIEHGVFAGFVAIATLALGTRATIECTYLEKDKPRITSLLIS
jgi:hypothetical protein